MPKLDRFVLIKVNLRSLYEKVIIYHKIILVILSLGVALCVMQMLSSYNSLLNIYLRPNLHAIYASRLTIEEDPFRIIITDKLNKLQDGELLFNPPSSMKVGISELIEVRIAKGTNAKINEGLKGHGIPQVEKMKVASLMRVQLSGNNFEIQKIGEEDQIVREDNFTEWAWNVTPEKSGKQILYLSITIRIFLPNNKEEYWDIPIKEKEIIVHVNPAYFVSNNWKQIIGWGIAVLSTLISSGIIIRKRRDRKRKIK
jgi:hypothetical protein